MPADPNSPAPERDPYEADESEAPDEVAADAFDLEALQKRADIPGLLALAKAYRSGAAPTGRDLKKCLEAYRAAADLGNGEAEYAVALFLMNGGAVVTQDLKEGTTRLRSAAEKGSVPAKVYLGNLYELGIHYKTDPEKADVWYRNAGRTAHIEAEQGGQEWNRALADLGCARQVLALTQGPELGEDEKKRLLARAKAHGLGLRIREEAGDGDRATFVDALAGAEVTGPTGAPPPAAAVTPRERKDTSPETKQAKEKAKSVPPPPKPVDPIAKAAADKAASRKSAERKAKLASALGAFGYAILFMVAGIGAAYAASLGARELISRGHTLPVLGASTRYVFPITLGLIGVLPSWLVYKFGTMLKAIAIGAALGGVGWVAWGTGRGALHSDRPIQALAFALGGFLAGLLVLGLLGGAKQPRPARRS